jgi:hypothetical protein
MLYNAIFILASLCTTNNVSSENVSFFFSEGFLKNHWHQNGTATRLEHPSHPLEIRFSPYTYVAFQHAFILQPLYEALILEYSVSQPTGDFLKIRLGHPHDNTFPWVPITLQHRTPTEKSLFWVRIPFSSLNPTHAPFDRILISTTQAAHHPPVHIHSLGFIHAQKPTGTATYRASLTLDCKAPVHRISPWIYGAYQNTSAHHTASAWGGASTTRYHWISHATNMGAPGFYTNTHAQKTNLLPWQTFASIQHKGPQRIAVTVPITPYVAKDTHSYAYPIRTYGSQRSFLGTNPDAGNGLDLTGNPLPSPPPLQINTPYTPQHTAQWLAAWTQHTPSITQQTPFVFLGYNPAQWHILHADLYNTPVSYEDLYTQSITHAQAVKKTWPQAHVVFSNMEHTGFIEWVLKETLVNNTSASMPFFQGLGFHYTPPYLSYASNDPDPFEQGRIQSVRNLWDNTYTDPYSPSNSPTRLFSKIRTLLESYGITMPVHITSYQWGGTQHISGLISQSEALGRFAEHAIESAFYEPHIPKNSAIDTAFEIYRSTQPERSGFLEYFLETPTPHGFPFFVSTNTTRTKMVAILINQNPHEVLEAQLLPVECASLKLKQAHVTEGYHTLVPLKKTVSEDRTTHKITLPPYSVAVLEFENM